MIKLQTISPENLDEGIIKGYASIFGHKDHHNDVVVKGAFEKTLRAWKLHGKWPKMLWQHDTKKPIGVWNLLKEDERGLYVEGQLNLKTQQGGEAFELLKQGAIEGLSIGFRTLKARESKGNRGRDILDLDLLEISLVTFPSNTRAQVHSLKTEFST